MDWLGGQSHLGSSLTDSLRMTSNIETANNVPAAITQILLTLVDVLSVKKARHMRLYITIITLRNVETVAISC